MVNMSGEIDSFTTINNRTEFEKYFLDYQNKLTYNVASMMNIILAFQKGLIHSSDFEDEDSFWLHLSHIVNINSTVSVVNGFLGNTKNVVDDV